MTAEETWSAPKTMGAAEPSTTPSGLTPPPDNSTWSEPQTMGPSKVETPKFDTSKSQPASDTGVIAGVKRGASSLFGMLNPMNWIAEPPLTTNPQKIQQQLEQFQSGLANAQAHPVATIVGTGLNQLQPGLGEQAASLIQRAPNDPWGAGAEAATLGVGAALIGKVAHKVTQGSAEARTSANRAKIQALAPTMAEDVAHLAPIADRIPALSGVTQHATDAAVFRNLQSAETALDTARKSVPASAVVLKEPLLDRLDNFISSIGDSRLSGNRGALAAVKELRSRISSSGFSIPFNEVYGILRDLDKRTGESGGFRLTTESDAAMNWARRGAAGVLSDTLKDAATNSGATDFVKASQDYNVAKTMAQVVEHRRPEVWGMKTTADKLAAAGQPAITESKSITGGRFTGPAMSNLRANIYEKVATPPKQPTPAVPSRPAHPMSQQPPAPFPSRPPLPHELEPPVPLRVPSPVTPPPSLEQAIGVQPIGASLNLPQNMLPPGPLRSTPAPIPSSTGPLLTELGGQHPLTARPTGMTGSQLDLLPAGEPSMINPRNPSRDVLRAPGLTTGEPLLAPPPGTSTNINESMYKMERRVAKGLRDLDVRELNSKISDIKRFMGENPYAPQEQFQRDIKLIEQEIKRRGAKPLTKF